MLRIYVQCSFNIVMRVHINFRFFQYLSSMGGGGGGGDLYSVPCTMNGCELWEKLSFKVVGYIFFYQFSIM